MGMPMLDRNDWTAKEVRRLNEATPAGGPRYEVVDGELLVTPAPVPRHQRACTRLVLLLAPFVDAQKLGEALVSPADIEFSPRRLVQPDVFVIPFTASGAIKSWRDVRSLLLAVEVLSPRSGRADRQVKRRLFQQEHVPEYWIVDLDARLFERWRPDDERPEVLTDSITWLPIGALSPLVLDLHAYFASVLDI